jgi:hypothetical protein
LDLSEGEFDIAIWEKAHDKAKEECCKVYRVSWKELLRRGLIRRELGRTDR